MCDLRSLGWFVNLTFFKTPPGVENVVGSDFIMPHINILLRHDMTAQHNFGTHQNTEDCLFPEARFNFASVYVFRVVGMGPLRLQCSIVPVQ